MERALDGIRIIEIASYLAGPHAGMMLADLGAEVLKIEPLENDYNRSAPGGVVKGETIYFLSGNRNKKSVAVDMKREEGRAVVRDLAKVSDVVLDNLRPGVMEKLGLDYATLSTVNPRIICCSISGFGRDGPYRDRPAFDYLVQGWGGIAHMLGDEHGEPRTTRLSMMDLVSGIHATVGILAALQARHRTGRGQAVDIALLDTAWAMLDYHIASYLATGQVTRRLPGSAHPHIAPAQIFQTADSHLAILTPNDAFFAKLCVVMGLPELVSDARFATPQSRSAHRVELVAPLQARFLTRTTAEWMADFLAADVPAAPVNDLPAMLADPQVRLRGGVVTAHHPVAGEVAMVGNPIKLSDNAEVFEPAPLLGQHTSHVLVDLMGYTEERVERLVETGVCRVARVPSHA